MHVPAVIVKVKMSSKIFIFLKNMSSLVSFIFLSKKFKVKFSSCWKILIIDSHVSNVTKQ